MYKSQDDETLITLWHFYVVTGFIFDDQLQALGVIVNSIKYHSLNKMNINDWL